MIDGSSLSLGLVAAALAFAVLAAFDRRLDALARRLGNRPATAVVATLALLPLAVMVLLLW